jgi:acyl dehydratase
VQTGDAFETQTFVVTRADLVRYAGASGDFNPIHWSDRVATSVGLPGVIAHGMYTMALAARALDSWAGKPGRVRELGCKFTKPVIVPDDDQGVALQVAGTVKDVTEDSIVVALEVTCGGEKVLGLPKAVLARG